MQLERDELFLVGGAVRDLLRSIYLNIPTEVSSDLDFATPYTPMEIANRLTNLGLPVIPIGVSFGTIQTIYHNKKVEITTFRCKESYTKNSRKPKVVFGKTIQEDLARRDLTINAMALNKDGEIIDPFNGLDDLVNGILRTPINPDNSFSDDPLRMLRICRFVSRGYGRPNKDTILSMTKNSELIKTISAERVFEEFTKILMSNKAIEGLKLATKTKLIKNLFPELQRMINFRKNQGEWHSKNVWGHTLGVVENSIKKPELLWAALFHDIGKPSTYKVTESGIHFYGHEEASACIWNQVAKRLRVSNNFNKYVGELIKEHMQPSLLTENVSNRALRRLIAKLDNKIDDLFELSKADITSHRKDRVVKKITKLWILKNRIDDIREREDIPRLKLPKGTGNLLMNALGLKEGKELGSIMKTLNEQLINGDISLQEDLVLAARKIYHG